MHGAEPWVAFILPSLMHTIAFRREADRRTAALKPFRYASQPGVGSLHGSMSS